MKDYQLLQFCPQIHHKYRTFNSCNLQPYYKVVPPPSDIRDAAAAAAVGTTPVEIPGFDKCRSLKNKCQKLADVTVRPKS